VKKDSDLYPLTPEEALASIDEVLLEDYRKKKPDPGSNSMQAARVKRRVIVAAYAKAKGYDPLHLTPEQAYELIDPELKEFYRQEDLRRANELKGKGQANDH
jgi:hypothetical protein